MAPTPEEIVAQGYTILTDPSQIPNFDIKGQSGETDAPGSFLFGTKKPTEDVPKAEIGMIDTGSAVTQVKKQKKFLDDVSASKIDFSDPSRPDTGRNLGNISPDMMSDAELKRANSESSNRNDIRTAFEERFGSGQSEKKAFFTNEEGQEAEFSQEQLDDPSVQQFIQNGGFVQTKTDGAGLVDPESKRLQQEVSDANDRIEGLINDFESFDVDKDPAFQRKAASIRAEFGRLRNEMTKTNQQRQRAFETLGFRTGSTRFAGAVQLGIEGEEIRQGGERIAELTRQESASIDAARLAFETGEFNEFNTKVNAFKDLREIKAKELESYNTAIANASKRLQDEQKLLQEQTTFAQGQLEFRQGQEERTAGLIAPNILSISESGELTFDPAELTQIALESNVSPLVLRTATENEIRVLNKLSAEERKVALDRKNTESQIAAREASEERAETLFPLELEEKLAKLDELKQISTGERLSDEDRDLLLKLRTEANKDPDVSGFVAIRDSFDRVQASAVDPSAAGDLALIFNFMKVLDPGSVVRESEFATAANAGGVDDRTRALYNKVVDGKRLSADQRADFVNRAGRLFEPKKRNFDQAIDFYQSEAREFGLPEDRVVRDFLTPEVEQPTFNNVNEFLNFETGGSVEQIQDFQTRLQEAGIDENDTSAVNSAFQLFQQQTLGTGGGSRITDIPSKRELNTLSDGQANLSKLGSGTITGIDGSSLWKWGLDFVLSGGLGANVTSPFSGIIQAVTRTGGFGNRVKVRLDDGNELWLSHLKDIDVKKGDQISVGDMLGTQGNSGSVLGGKGERLTSAQRKAGRGTHLDLTIQKPDGTFFTPREVAAILGDKRITA